MNSFSKMLMQGIQFKLSEKSQETRMIYMFDIERERSLKTQPFFFLNSFEGLGQLNYNNNLYLCGGIEMKKGGTYFLVYDPVKIFSSLSMSINCLFEHKYPTMIGYKNDFIIVVGGQESNMKCEIYGLNKRKWKALPDLPEPRYGCSLLNEEKHEFIYLFGGISNDSYCGSVLRLNMKSLIIWESVIVVDNSSLLQKSQFSIIQVDRSTLYLLGGSKIGEDMTDSIVEFDLASKSAKPSNLKLSRPAKFLISNSVDLNNKNFFIFDTQSFVHNIDLKERKLRDFNYVDNIQEEENNTHEN